MTDLPTTNDVTGAPDLAPVGPGRLRHAEHLADAIEHVRSIAVSSLSDDEVRAELAAVEEARRVLDARACRLTSALTSRAAADARAASGSDDPRVGERAARHVRAELAETFRLTPSDVLRAQQVGDRVDGSPAVAQAMDAGQITPDQVRAVDRVCRHLTGLEREQAERHLVEVARLGSVRDVHDAGVRLLAKLDHDAAVDEEQRKHARRECSVTRTRHGTVAIHGELSGLQGELLLTAWHAFRRPDRRDERRTPGQRGADALADLCEAAVNGGSPPTQHGVQPHLSVTVDLDTFLTGKGTAETDWSGPVVWGAVRDQLEGAGLTFIALRDEIPIAVTRQTRYIPTGLWKAVKLRDKGCVHRSCDAPAQWCQVAHLGKWFKDGGKLALDQAALLCTSHHRAFDAGRLAITWTRGHPVAHPP